MAGKGSRPVGRELPMLLPSDEGVGRTASSHGGETTASVSTERRPVGAKVLKLTETARKKVSSGLLADKLALDVVLSAMQHVAALHGPLIRKLTAL